MHYKNEEKKNFYLLWYDNKHQQNCSILCDTNDEKSRQTLTLLLRADDVVVVLMLSLCCCVLIEQLHERKFEICTNISPFGDFLTRREWTTQFAATFCSNVARHSGRQQRLSVKNVKRFSLGENICIIPNNLFLLHELASRLSLCHYFS